MTENELPVPVDPFDGPVAQTSVDFPAYDASGAVAPVRERGVRRLGLVVAGLAAVLCVGAGVAIALLWPHGGAGSAAAPVSSTPAPATSSVPAPVDPGDAATWPELATVADDTATTGGDAETRIAFVNNSATPVVVSWLDDGKSTPYATVAPGETYLQTTYAGHIWTVTHADGTRVATFQAAEQPGRAIVS